MQHVTILGSTGSIGTQALSVIEKHPTQFCIEALTAQSNEALLYQQCLRFKPRYALLIDTSAALALSKKLKTVRSKTEVLTGVDALCQIAGDHQSDVVIAAIVGAAGLQPTLTAVKKGKRVLLANKEALVMSGSLFVESVRQSGAQVLPVDSEHNAIFQCLPDSFVPCVNQPEGVRSIILTASGGPFRTASLIDLERVTPEEAVAHPNWKMGQKISVDSATMMNKGLEVIEAYWLFGLPLNKIKVLIHPQSTIHSLVNFEDGSVLAQLGVPDMRIPIANALAWPTRISSGASELDLIKISQLNFEPMSFDRYPCLQLAYQALQTGGTAPALLNAANEMAVQAFLSRQIRFTQISEVVASVMDAIEVEPASDLSTVLEADKRARMMAKNRCLLNTC